MIAVFDLDGTLVDTAPLVVKAYGEAGVDVLPQELRLHWTEWLLPKVEGSYPRAALVRSKKTTLYIQALKREPPARTLLGNLAKELLDAGQEVRVITAGHPAGARAVLQAIGLEAARIIGVEVAGEDRPEILSALAPEGTYYDDNADTVSLVEKETNWEAILA